MKVYLVQHGKTKNENEDPRRPLSEKGVEETRRMADVLAGSGMISVKKIFHSGKLRTKQTADIFALALSPVKEIMETKGINPMDDPEKCAGIIKKERQDIMIVGHLPNLSKVVSLMVIGDTERQIAAFSFSCVICIEKQPDGSWTMAPVFSL